MEGDLVRMRSSAQVQSAAELHCDQIENNRDVRPARQDQALRQIPADNEWRLWLFLAIWFAAGVLQSIFTNLDGEEAYYATFARHLAWGYFDHPPALALFVRLGMLIFPGDLGPRFLLVLMSTATLWIGSRLVQRSQIPIYIAAVAGLALTQAGSFLIKTDVPLLFFAAAFFYFYREYLRGRERIAIAALPIAIAGMLLSKYHGLLVVALTLLSNPMLLKRPSFWLIALLSAVLILPHALWLYSHDFITIRYHLGGRTDGGFSWKNVFGYLFMQPFVFGPVIGVLLLPAALLAKSKDAFERALKFNLIGILAFFCVASFAVRIHMHWTSIALIPLLALAIPYIYDRPPLRKLFVQLAVVTVVAVIPIRVYLAWDFLPAFIDRKMQIVHGWDHWAQDVRRLADGRCVVFLDDYGSAGKYTYYTGETSHCYNSLWYENTQHDIWPIEESFRGKRAMIVNGTYVDHFQTTHATNGVEIRYRFVDDFQAYSKIKILLTASAPIHCVAEKPFDVPITLINHYDSPIAFEAHTELAPLLAYYFFKGDDLVTSGSFDFIAGTTLKHDLTRTVELRPPAIPGNYTLRLAIRPGWLPPSGNSAVYAVTVGPASEPSFPAAVGVN